MSDDKQMIDYSNYDGDYQEGELLGEDGQAIDLDELKQQQEPPKVPIVIKLIIVLICGGLGAFAYMTLSKEGKKTPPPPPPRVERSEILQNALKHMNDSRVKTYQSLARCWELLGRGEAKKVKVTTALLRKNCPAQKGSTLSFEPRCKGDGCDKVALFRCKKGACKAVEDAKYLDFVYFLLQRVADGHHLLQAYVRLYQRAFAKRKSQERRWSRQKAASGGKQAKPPETLVKLRADVKRYESLMNRILHGKFASSKLWTTPYFGLPADTYLAQVFKRSQGDNADDGDDDDDDDDRGSRRRGKTPILKGGKLIGYGSWPLKATTLPAYRSIDRFRFEAYDETPFLMLARADHFNIIDYTPAALNFWTHMFLQQALHRCARKVTGSNQVKIDVEMVIDVQSGQAYPNTIKLKMDKPQPAVQTCIRSAVRGKRLAYRGLKEDWKRVLIQYSIHLFPKSPDSNP